MKNQYILKCFRNSRNAVIFDLYIDDKRLLATSHPATISAALFAMGASEFIFKREEGEHKFSFPLRLDEVTSLGNLLTDQAEADLWSGMLFFSNINFLNPPSIDTQAEKHLRLAVHHIAPEYIKNCPVTPPLSSFKRELNRRNKFIYFPHC
jgi:hypothetical protein